MDQVEALCYGGLSIATIALLVFLAYRVWFKPQWFIDQSYDQPRWTPPRLVEWRRQIPDKTVLLIFRILIPLLLVFELLMLIFGS